MSLAQRSSGSAEAPAIASRRERLARSLRWISSPAAIAASRRKLPVAALLALPGALTVYTAFRAGGYFPGTQGVLAVALAMLLLARVMLADDPLAGASRAFVAAGLALGLFAGWVLLSASWSHAPARAMLEFDRALLYLLVLTLFALVPMTADRLRWMVRGLALAIAVVCAFAFVSRTLPEVLVTPYVPEDGRLRYPVTYSNALGLLGVLGAILLTHLTSDDREPRTARVLAAAALPVVAAAVYLTFSRAALFAGAIGLVLYLVSGRPRLLISGLVAAGPAVAIVIATAYGARALASTDRLGPAVVAQGRQLAQVLALCTLGAALARGLLLPADSLIARRRRRLPKRLGWMAPVLATAAAAIVFVSVGGPEYVRRQYDVFAHGQAARPQTDLRQRFLDVSNLGRPDFWGVALRGFRAEPLHGHGAGTYQQLWNYHRTYSGKLIDAHSLYLESLAEVGVIGLGLVAIALLTLLWALARRARGPDRTAFAVILAAAAAWALHAGLEWDWEMPVVTLWLFALGGAALAVPLKPATEAGARGAGRHAGTVRLLAGLGCLVVAVMPARVALSQEHLNRSVAAFQRGDCQRTVREALASIAATDARPEPYQLLGYCDVAMGLPLLAVRAMDAAVSRDPRHWEYSYGLALVRGAAGLDPRPSARRALALNPLEPLAIDAVKRFATDDPALWRRRAREARLSPISS